MSARRVAAVARRIVALFRRDHRSLGLLVAAPLLVLSLVGALWASNLTATVRVVVADDPVAPPQLLGALAAAGLQIRAARYEEGLADLRAGRADAVVRFDPPGLRIDVEGSDSFRTASTLAAVQKALLPAAAPGQPAVRVEYLYGGADYSLLDYLAPVLIGFFGFFFIFLLSAVSFLRERTSGTLERLLATPLQRGELVAGYLLGFGTFALLQALIIVTFTFFVLRVQYRGNLATIFLVEAAVVAVAVSLGLLVSAFARTELQAVQFIPLILLPQVFLSGLLVPVEQLPEYLRPISVVLPLTYANEALRSVMVKGYPVSDPVVVRDLAVLAGFALLAAAGALASIRREVA